MVIAQGALISAGRQALNRNPIRIPQHQQEPLMVSSTRTSDGARRLRVVPTPRTAREQAVKYRRTHIENRTNRRYARGRLISEMCSGIGCPQVHSPRPRRYRDPSLSRSQAESLQICGCGPCGQAGDREVAPNDQWQSACQARLAQGLQRTEAACVTTAKRGSDAGGGALIGAGKHADWAHDERMICSKNGTPGRYDTVDDKRTQRGRGFWAQ